MATVLLESQYATVVGNLRHLVPELPARFRILQAHNGSWRSRRAAWWVTVRELTEHMLCFGYAGYQLEVPTENGARKVDVYRDELLRVRMPMAGPAAELQAAIAENRAYAGR